MASHNGQAASSRAGPSSQRRPAPLNTAPPSFDLLDDENGNPDSFLDDDDGWHSTDMVAGFSPTSPGVRVMPMEPSTGLRQDSPSTSQPPSGTQPHDILGSDLDWDAWETPRGPTPLGRSEQDLEAAFNNVNLRSSYAQGTGPTTQRQGSPPIIDLRDMEKRLEAQRNGHSNGEPALYSNGHRLQQADLDFFEAFESAPQKVMDSSRDALRNQRKLQGTQLEDMTDAQDSPLDLTTPLPPGGMSGGEDGPQSYFDSRPQRSSSPVSIVKPEGQSPQPEMSPSRKGSWTGAAGSLAGSLRKTFGSIRGRLPSARDFLVPDEEDEEYRQAEALKAETSNGRRPSAERSASSPPQQPHHSRKLVHLDNVSQSTPFASHTSPSSAMSPPLARASTSVHNTSFGHHSIASIPGAPAFDPNAGRNWNTGAWSLTSREEVERSRRPIPVALRGRREETQDVIDESLAARLTAYLPRRLQLGKAWKLLYSSDQDGISLGTLYHKVEVGLDGARRRPDASPGLADAEGWLRGATETTRAAITGVATVGAGIDLKEAGLIVAVRDASNHVFGAFVNERLRAQTSYYGSGECFLWKHTNSDAVKTYKWTGRNDYMVLTENHYLSFGGGEGRYGLWLDRRLEQGISSPCPAFDNDILCDGSDARTAEGEKEGKFECIVLEVWACGID